MVTMTNATPMQKILESKFAPYLGMLIAASIGLIFAYFGLFTILCGIGGALLIGILLYMLPKSFGADFKKMLVFGVVFFVVCSMFAAFAVSKPLVESYHDPHDVRDLKNIQVTPFDQYSSSGYDITFDYTGSDGTTVEVHYATVTSIWSTGITTKDMHDLAAQPIVPVGNTFHLPALEDGKIYVYEIIVKNSEGKNVFIVSAFGPVLMDDGALTSFCITGNLYGIGLNVMVIFFMILLLTTWMRSKLEETRERMEREGRLYPQGYGRCKACGTIVLPGEVTCRKCGAYVDVPESMKPKKVEFFECSECGKEVPMNADTCPSCGATFDGVEDESATTTVVTTEKKPAEKVTCSECGNIVPADAIRCPFCGERFDN